MAMHLIVVDIFLDEPKWWMDLQEYFFQIVQKFNYRICVVPKNLLLAKKNYLNREYYLVQKQQQ